MSTKRRKTSSTSRVQHEKKRTKEEKNDDIQQKFLTICLFCGQHILHASGSITSKFQNHVCGEENLNNFTKCMSILKTKAVEIIDSHGLIAPQTISAAKPPTPPPMPPPTLPRPPLQALQNSCSSSQPRLSYLDELKTVLK